MYSTRIHVYTRASLTDNLVRIVARIARVGQVGEDPIVRVRLVEIEITNGQTGSRECTLQQTAGRLSVWEAEQRSRQTRRHSSDDPCEDVGVGVCVGVVEWQL